MSVEPTFIDHALSARLEAGFAAQLEAFARAVAKYSPSRGAAVAEIAGGRAVFLAPHISVSRAVGLGMAGPVEAADIIALEKFYASRDTDARILVSPFAHPSLIEHLGDRDFRLQGLDTILVRGLHPLEYRRPPEGLAVRRAALDRAPAWVYVSLTAFASPEPPPLGLADIFEAGFHAPGASYYFGLFADDTVAGTAALHEHNGAALLFATSTSTVARGRGVQRALIEARLAHARRSGCDIAFAATTPGSGSQRNLERAGFVPVYSEALLVKELSSGDG